MNAKRIGLVGCGLWGQNILRDLKALGQRVWVAEPDSAARERAATTAEGVASRADEIENVDGWIVATPASTHEAVVSALLPGGRPVLCEKPLTTDAAAARRLVAAAAGRLFVGHIWCYHPGIEALAAIARAGELGPVLGLRSTRTNWSSPRRDVDSVWNLAPHDVALAQFILGKIPTPRFAVAELHDGRCRGMLAILGAAPWAVFEVSNRYREKRREVRLHCRDGVAVLPDADSPHLEISRAGAGVEPMLELRPLSRESALRRELAAFCGYLDGGAPPKTTAADGLAAVETIEALRVLAGLPPT